MSKFSLNSLAKVLSEKSGLSQMEAELFIRKMFDVCNQGLDKDKLVKIKWLGTFKVQAVKDRASIDVNTGERIVIEGRDKLSFTPDNIIKEIVNKPFSQFETVVVNDGVDFEDIDQKFVVEEHNDEPSQTDKEDEEKEQAITNDVQNDEENDEENDEVIYVLDGEIPSEPSSEETIFGGEQPEAETEETLTEETETEVGNTEEEEPETEVVTTEEEPQEEAKDTPKEEPKEEPKKEPKEEAKEPATDSHHLLIPRYMAVAVCIIVIALMGGMGWFAYNYDKMTAQRDNLVMQLTKYQQAPPKKPAPKKPAVQPPMTPEQMLRKKAIDDSIRMAQPSEAVKIAEQAEKLDDAEKRDDAEKKDKAEKQDKAEKKDKADKQDKAEPTEQATSKYDNDARVRTGAYRITGVAEVVTVKAGQSIANISKRYLGPGMECYVEAINGTSTVKEGQKIKIPKLELKKKK